jgi:GTP cyclohydrolase I
MSLQAGKTDAELGYKVEEYLISKGVHTPIDLDKLGVKDERKIAKIEKNFAIIMETLGLDLTDDSLIDTPKRVAKMYVREVFWGLKPENFPQCTVIDNKMGYDEMVIEKDITVMSNCEHHFVPIIGKAHVAYISNGTVIGLSKLNRIVQYFAKRPQVQERLTIQIAKELQKALNTDDVAVIIDAKHLCVSSRGVQDGNAATVTSFYGGKFENEATKQEFLKYIEMKTQY